MDLKDFFAAHVAAALAHRIERADVIANRAYELADALLRERGRRTKGDLEDFDDGHEVESLDPFDDAMPDEDFFRPTLGLLDEPAPFSEREGFELDPSWLERQDDPRWEVEPKWGPVAASSAAGAAERPGLARTAPPQQKPEEEQAIEKARRPA